MFLNTFQIYIPFCISTYIACPGKNKTKQNKTKQNKKPKNPTLITLFLHKDDIQLEIQVPPPPDSWIKLISCKPAKVNISMVTKMVAQVKTHHHYTQYTSYKYKHSLSSCSEWQPGYTLDNYRSSSGCTDRSHR